MSTELSKYPIPERQDPITPIRSNLSRLIEQADRLSFISRTGVHETSAQQLHNEQRVQKQYGFHHEVLGSIATGCLILHLPHTQINMHNRPEGVNVRVLSHWRHQDALYRFRSEDGEINYDAVQHVFLNTDKQYELDKEGVQVWRAAAVLQLVGEIGKEAGHPAYQDFATE